MAGARAGDGTQAASHAAPPGRWLAAPGWLAGARRALAALPGWLAGWSDWLAGLAGAPLATHPWLCVCLVVLVVAGEAGV